VHMEQGAGGCFMELCQSDSDASFLLLIA
jgi:hypothetical protein